MGEGVMRGKNTREKDSFFFGQGELFFRLGDCIGDLFWGGEACGRTVRRGHLLLGVLGSGARNPYGILELGSRRGSVPSWLGG
jgi:hypothetical protein